MAFARTFRAGGSSIQNMLFRHWMKHSEHLLYADPYLKEDDEEEANVYNLRTMYHVSNYSNSSAKYVTVLRDPASILESSYSFLGIGPITGRGVNYFVRSMQQYNMTRYNETHARQNSLLFDLGLDESDLDNATAAEAKIDEIEKRFDLVMIAERFEESLVLLADLLCWPMEELTSIKRREKVDHVKMDNSSKLFMRQWLKEDYMVSVET